MLWVRRVCGDAPAGAMSARTATRRRQSLASVEVGVIVLVARRRHVLEE
jgi:hypothetical protein